MAKTSLDAVLEQNAELEQEVEHMARADNEAEQERLCLRQESATLTKTSESLEKGRRARERSRRRPNGTGKGRWR